ncbi:MAG: DUF1343 domain-containing protein [Gammaproteobacteria bacterium]|nr:DUF1343 domain-containing protein [Gammaproteobacteria bacterium]MBT8052058.1 DUF1343 domain-containing protein [Gammaproteobacteria bacterium]
MSRCSSLAACLVALSLLAVGPAGAGENALVENPGRVLTGIDVLARDDFRALAGQRVGLITNHTGVDGQGVPTLRRLHDAANVDLAVLFSPEHGLRGRLDVVRIADSEEEGTGLRVFSLYGDTRKPSSKMLDGLDTLVFDIQDIGTRFYTYISTLGLAMEAAAEAGLRFVVLDRPNPINGVDLAGPVTDPGSESFTAFHSLPVRHGMTVGELAGLFRDERGLQLDLVVIRLQNWKRPMFYDATGLRWINPSPNMRSLAQALLYPGIGLLETTNLSVGRGTDTPFEVFGAPWLDERELALQLNGLDLPGVVFVPVRFTPDASKFAGEECGGVNILVVNRETFQPVRTGLAIARVLRTAHPERWELEAYARLLVSERALTLLRDGAGVDDLEAAWSGELEAFRQRRARHLLYE